MPLKTFLEFFGMEKVISEIRCMMEDQKLGIYFMVTNYKGEEDVKYCKELLVFHDESLMPDADCSFTELRDMLADNKQYKLRDEQEHEHSEGLPMPSECTLITWNVGNTKMSRKDLEKILKEFYIHKINSDFIQDGFSLSSMEWFN